MRRLFILFLIAILFPAASVAARDATPVRQPEAGQEKPKETHPRGHPDPGQGTPPDANKGGSPDAKELSGMSIVGNEDAPKSLYIVPWKSSDIGAQTGLDTMLNEGDTPVDRDVFKRQIEFYQISTGK
jgi:hypothetical protein